MGQQLAGGRQQLVTAIGVEGPRTALDDVKGLADVAL